MTPLDPTRFTYNMAPPSVERLHNQTNDDSGSDVSPPTLPPRNYRSNNTSATSLRQVPQPQEPSSRERTSGSGNARPESQRSSGGGYPDVFGAGEVDQTPEHDAYVDKLREQSRRISQSKHTQLLPARYQPKAVDYKTDFTVANSRPVTEAAKLRHEALAPSASQFAEKSRRSLDHALPSQQDDINGSRSRFANTKHSSSMTSLNVRKRGEIRHSPQHSFPIEHDTSSRGLMTSHSPQTSALSNVSAPPVMGRSSPRHSRQPSAASSTSSKSSSASRGSRHSPQTSIVSMTSSTQQFQHSPQQSGASDVMMPPPLAPSNDFRRNSNPHTDPAAPQDR